VKLCLHFAGDDVQLNRMPVKITKDEFGVTADGKHIAR